VTREHFERDLRQVERNVLSLGEIVAGALIGAVHSFVENQSDDARRLVEFDERINEQRLRIELETLTLIATQQPVAGDIRRLAGVLDVAGELERIGDYAKGIAQIGLDYASESRKPAVITDLIVQMGSHARDMLDRAVGSFGTMDLDRARIVIADDDVVDALFKQVFAETVSLASSLSREPERAIECANYLLWVAHNLERSADRATNICERTIFTATGRYPQPQSAAALTAG